MATDDPLAIVKAQLQRVVDQKAREAEERRIDRHYTH
jgi:hypothetical protein